MLLIMIHTKPEIRTLETVNIQGQIDVIPYLVKNGDTGFDPIKSATLPKECETKSNASKVNTNNEIKKVYDTKQTDYSDLMPPRNLNLEECHIQDIIIDPDKQLSEKSRALFHETCSLYKDVINP